MEERVRIAPAKVDTAPVFAPWLGDEFARVREAGGAECCVPNWHILAESHYGSDGDLNAELTKRVMRDLAIPGYRFFDTVLSIATGKPVDQLDRRQDWQPFAFSNFVQDLLQPGARPTPEQWAHGKRCFFAQLATTRPKLLLVVGKQTWDQLPLEGATKLDPIRLWDDSGVVDDLWLYSYEHGGQVRHVIATWIYHPSARGLLKLDEARLKVKSVGANICNIMSCIEDRDGVSMLERWSS